MSLRKLFSITVSFDDFCIRKLVRNSHLSVPHQSAFRTASRRMDGLRWISPDVPIGHGVTSIISTARLFKRFDIAFKSSGKLAGLAYGVPTAHKTGLKIDLIEATPIRDDKHGRKVFELISYSAQVYAAMLGADEIRIMKPTTASTRAYYESWGYDYVDNSEKPSRPDYCVMRLR